MTYCDCCKHNAAAQLSHVIFPIECECTCGNNGAPIEQTFECEPAPRDEMPSAGKQLWNLTKSLADFVSDGCTMVSPEQYEERLAICTTCTRRRGNRCLECGCRLSVKARGRAFQCPLNKWPEVKNDNAGDAAAGVEHREGDGGVRAG